MPTSTMPTTRLTTAMVAAVTIAPSLGACSTDDDANTTTTSTAPPTTSAAATPDEPSDLDERVAALAGPDARVEAITGTVATRVTTNGWALDPDPGFEYYAELSLDRPGIVLGPGGELLTTDDLLTGQRIDLRIDPACGESYPVQCGVWGIQIIG